jgi:hypothetical protein
MNFREYLFHALRCIEGKTKGQSVLKLRPFLSASGDEATTKLVSLLPLAEPLDAIANFLNVDASLLQCSTDALVVEDAE